MRNKSFSGILVVILALTCLPYCGNLGKVDQGRVIAFDKVQGTVTFIRNSRPTPDAASAGYVNPAAGYGILPPVTFTIPSDPAEMGPNPVAGKRIKLDAAARQVVFFDTSAGDFRVVQYTLMEQKDNVIKEDPLVAGKKFPIIDPRAKTITLYSGKQKTLVTFQVPEADFSLPPDTWVAGDEVRVYFKQPGKALRMMNVTQTDIFKK